MSTGGAIGLALGLVGALVGVVVAGFGIWLAVRYSRRSRTNTQPTTRSGPYGEVVDIPVIRIYRAPLLAPVGSLRAHGFATFRIHPTGIEYRIGCRTSVPFTQIADVDAPFDGRAYFTVRFHHRLTGIGVVATSEYVVREALWRLSQHCQLTERARARIHAG